VQTVGIGDADQVLMKERLKRVKRDTKMLNAIRFFLLALIKIKLICGQSEKSLPEKLVTLFKKYWEGTIGGDVGDTLLAINFSICVLLSSKS